MKCKPIVRGEKRTADGHVITVGHHVPRKPLSIFTTSVTFKVFAEEEDGNVYLWCHELPHIEPLKVLVAAWCKMFEQDPAGVILVTKGNRELDQELTSIEHRLRHETGEFGFIDRYLEEIVYPEELTTVLRLTVAILVAVAYWGWLRRRGPHLNPV